MKISRYLNYLIICEKLYLGVYRKNCVKFKNKPSYDKIKKS